MPDPTSTVASRLLDFTGDLVVVTGIASGLGSAIAHAFTALGARVVGIDRDPGKEFDTVRADLADATAVAHAFTMIDARHGAPRVLVNNAGVREVSTVVDLEPGEWDRVVGVNLNGVYYCAREAALRMRKNGGGAIVNMSSVAGLIGVTHRPAYTATKHAVLGLTKNLAVDLAHYGIRVNAVAPGTVRTPLTEHYYADDEFLAEFETVVPLGATGTPDDVANACLFLASPLAAYITGVVLPVDGGWSTSKSYSYKATSAYTQGARTT
ncbi:SDR family NAD(P)-dependent oxidoreductase [Pseudonocardia sichuanensis]